jgi:hypothetical protein
LLNSRPQGYGGTTIGETILNMMMLGKYLKIFIRTIELNIFKVKCKFLEIMKRIYLMKPKLYRVVSIARVISLFIFIYLNYCFIYVTFKVKNMGTIIFIVGL